MNPLLNEFNTPFQVPPFEEINSEHFIPAYKERIKDQKEKIEEIISNKNEPTFENTIEALESSYRLIKKIKYIFYVFQNAITNEEIQNVAGEMASLASINRDDILFNEELFNRVRAVFKQKDILNLSEEQNSLLEKYYKDFVRGGAELDADKKNRLGEINKKLALLLVKFDDNILAEINNFKLIIDNEDDLAGLPKSSIDAAKEVANEIGQEGKWVFTIHKPSMIPFLQNAENRNLREKIFKAYINKGDNDNENDNKEFIKEMIELRIEKAHLLGYKSFSEYILDKNMAKNPENVYKFLAELWEAALPVAKKEVKELQKIADNNGDNIKIKAWDWWYYSEKLKKEKYDLNEEMLKPYFPLENVKAGLFDVVNKLYGLKFKELTNVPKYHEDVQVYEVTEADGSHIGILYQDFYIRASKQGGAWMSSIRKQYKNNDGNVPPIISIVCNFPKPTTQQPSLLSFDQVATFYHEFGHALHGLLSDCTYEEISGTSVARDFVELCSQIMENWAETPSVIQSFAKHYETGEVIPDAMLDKIKQAAYFNQGFITIEYLAASILDLDWHTLTEIEDINVTNFENESMNKIGLIPEIVPRYRSTYFGHIFAGNYFSGYYSYMWAEVLDADAFEAFKETSLFDQETALSFRKNILEKGGSEDPMKLYRRFRGADPKMDALLRSKGLK